MQSAGMQPDLDALSSRLRFKVNHHTKASTQHNQHRLAFAVGQRQQIVLAQSTRAQGAGKRCFVQHVAFAAHVPCTQTLTGGSAAAAEPAAVARPATDSICTGRRGVQRSQRKRAEQSAAWREEGCGPPWGTGWQEQRGSRLLIHQIRGARLADRVLGPRQASWRRCASWLCACIPRTRRRRRGRSLQTTRGRRCVYADCCGTLRGQGRGA